MRIGMRDKKELEIVDELAARIAEECRRVVAAEFIAQHKSIRNAKIQFEEEHKIMKIREAQLRWALQQIERVTLDCITLPECTRPARSWKNACTLIKNIAKEALQNAASNSPRDNFLRVRSRSRSRRQT